MRPRIVRRRCARRGSARTVRPAADMAAEVITEAQLAARRAGRERDADELGRLGEQLLGLLLAQHHHVRRLGHRGDEQ